MQGYLAWSGALKVRVPIAAKSRGFHGIGTRAGHDIAYNNGSLFKMSYIRYSISERRYSKKLEIGEHTIELHISIGTSKHSFLLEELDVPHIWPA